MAETDTLHVAGPGSYTHLDVYKRQVHTCVLESGIVKVGDHLTAQVDKEYRLSLIHISGRVGAENKKQPHPKRDEAACKLLRGTTQIAKDKMCPLPLSAR